MRVDNHVLCHVSLISTTSACAHAECGEVSCCTAPLTRNPPHGISALRIIRRSKATITDRSALLANLKRGRELGYFVTTGENVADVMAVAATVHLDGDVYGIAIAGPMHRMESNLTPHMSALTAACATIADMTHERAALQRMG